MPCEEGCRTAVFGKTERTVGWEGNGDPVRIELLRHCTRGNPQSTDRPCLTSLTHSFTLDFIIGFELESDAKRVKEVLAKRFNRYALELHPEKTALTKFGRPTSKSRAGAVNGTFDFLGFTFYWSKSLRGYWVIKKKTARKRLNRFLKRMWNWCKENRHDPIWDQYQTLGAKLRGFYQYFGVRSNYKALEVAYEYTERAWRYWLSRRSHKGMVLFEELQQAFPFPLPRIVHNI